MVKDVQGVMRAECTVPDCECQEYFTGATPCCGYCGHYPAQHRNADENSPAAVRAPPPRRGAVKPVEGIPSFEEPGGWPIGTMVQVRMALPDISDESLAVAMTSVDKSSGIQALIDRCMNAPSNVNGGRGADDEENDPFASGGGGTFGPRDPPRRQPPGPVRSPKPVPNVPSFEEPGGWPIGTMVQVRDVLPDISDESLAKAMTSVEPSKGVEALVVRCLRPDIGCVVEKEWPEGIVDTLAAQLPEIFPRDRIERVLATYHPKGDVDGILAALVAESLDIRTFECDLCMMEFRVDQMYTVDCGVHRFCFGCIGHCVTIGINENTPLMCPGKDCKHVLTETEVEQISRDPTSGVTKEMVDKYSTQLVMRTVRGIPDIVACPNPTCGNWMVLEDPSRRIRCICKNCKACFCSMCKKPFHFECECDDVPRLQQKWIDWMATGRMRYNRDKKDALDKINAAIEEIKQRNEHAKEVYKDLMRDEEFKCSNGRYCPKCKRVIIKNGGCDLMVCGRDYHDESGKIIDGCGHHFRWSEAEPYKSEVQKPTEEKEEVEIPPIAREYVHEGISCDICRQEIKGLRFRCINCPCCDFCEKCEIQGTLAHDKDHIFEIMEKEGSD